MVEKKECDVTKAYIFLLIRMIELFCCTDSIINDKIQPIITGFFVYRYVYRFFIYIVQLFCQNSRFLKLLVQISVFRFITCMNAVYSPRNTTQNAITKRNKSEAEPDPFRTRSHKYTQYNGATSLSFILSLSLGKNYHKKQSPRPGLEHRPLNCRLSVLTITLP